MRCCSSEIVLSILDRTVPTVVSVDMIVRVRLSSPYIRVLIRVCNQNTVKIMDRLRRIRLIHESITPLHWVHTGDFIRWSSSRTFNGCKVLQYSKKKEHDEIVNHDRFRWLLSEIFLNDLISSIHWQTIFSGMIFVTQLTLFLALWSSFIASGI